MNTISQHVCRCICMNVCMYIHLCVLYDMCMYICVHVCECMYCWSMSVYIYVCVYIYMSLYICINVFVYVSVYICACVYFCLCMYVCVCTCVQKHVYDAMSVEVRGQHQSAYTWGLLSYELPEILLSVFHFAVGMQSSQKPVTMSDMV